LAIENLNAHLRKIWGFLPFLEKKIWGFVNKFDIMVQLRLQKGTAPYNLCDCKRVKTGYLSSMTILVMIQIVIFVENETNFKY